MGLSFTELLVNSWFKVEIQLEQVSIFIFLMFLGSNGIDLHVFGLGRGGTSIYGAKFEDEIDGRLKHTGAGILSMANAGANTNGSQFFITLAPTQHLDGKHTIFGRISSGMKIIQRLGTVNTDANDRPLQEIRIIKAEPVDEEFA